MTRINISAFIIACLLAPTAASALPVYSRDCQICHGVGGFGSGVAPGPNEPGVISFDFFADPDETGTGAMDRGLLKVFLAEAGGAPVQFQINVDFGTTGSPPIDLTFAVGLRRMEVSGVENGGTLIYTAPNNPNWYYQTGGDPSRPYYTNQNATGILFTGPQTFSFNMQVDAASDNDYYDLEFMVAGKNGFDFFYWDEHFYLQVIPEPGTLALAMVSLAFLARRGRRGRRRRLPVSMRFSFPC